jgi:rubrerythrin
VGEKEVLDWLFRFPIFYEILGAEITLTESQKEVLKSIVKEEENKLRSLRENYRNYSVEEFNDQHDAILKESDNKIKQILSPIQYVRFRDWIIEQWTLERNQRALYHNFPTAPVVPVIDHWNEFIETQLFLSKDTIQTINQLIFQEKQNILQLRNKLTELGANPRIPHSKIQEEGKQIANQIRIRVQRLENNLKKVLSPDQYKIYIFYLKEPK